MLSELEKRRVEKIIGEWCNERVPEHIKNQLRYAYQISKQDVQVLRYGQKFGRYEYDRLNSRQHSV